jgi:hypothetical protein
MLRRVQITMEEAEAISAEAVDELAGERARTEALEMVLEEARIDIAKAKARER